MKIKPLPPMNSLIVFEAAARHLSFTKAANELNVTQGAISRQIRQLEEYLGKELFLRANRNISLTPTGLQYYQTIYSALLDVAQATAEIKKWQGEHQITVATTNAMAALWLLPKVAAFQQNNEGVDLRILTTDNISDLHKMDFDLALFYCRVPPAGERSFELGLIQINENFKFQELLLNREVLSEKNKQRTGKVFCKSSFKQGFVNEQGLFNTWIWVNFSWNGVTCFCRSNFWRS